jgi:uncharacterized protein YfaQ (DUF2300 family)
MASALKLMASMAMLAASTCAVATEPAAGELLLAWLDARGEVHSATLDAQGRAIDVPRTRWSADDAVPLGSLWKLVAHARLTDAAANESPYVCRSGNTEEVYCCEPGQRIDRGTALWRSCGLYFAPSRLKWDTLIAGDSVRALPASMRALSTVAAMRSDTTVPLGDWLRWLGDWPAAAQQAARDDLLGYWLQGPGRVSLGEVGSRLRLKTFTVEGRTAGTRWSGGSGWTREGTPLWMAALGSSARVVPQRAAQVLAHLDAQRAAGAAGHGASANGPCIDVDFFARYPVSSITPMPSSEGRLPAGAYTVRFDNGRTLPIESVGDLNWKRTATGGSQLTGRFALDDYVARVIDREAAGDPAAAAQALAVAARTYVLGRGEPTAGCLRIADSSATQRVAPRPASAAAIAAAAHTADLVLQGADGRFHSTDAKPGVMSWSRAVQMAHTGQTFDALLRSAYGTTSGLRSLGSGRGFSDCEALPLAAQWLADRQTAWRRQLQGEAGYRTPTTVQVCRLQQGRPHALRASGRIYASGVQSLEERLTLAHEYLHLAFSGHPRGADEAFIERRARQLLGVDG